MFSSFSLEIFFQFGKILNLLPLKARDFHQTSNSIRYITPLSFRSELGFDTPFESIRSLFHVKLTRMGVNLPCNIFSLTIDGENNRTEYRYDELNRQLQITNLNYH